MHRSLLAALILPAALYSQPKRKLEGEISGNIFFGNTRQILTSARTEYERADSGFAFRVQGRLNYGETTNDPPIGTVVSKRSWIVGTNYDWRPFADFTPFVKATMESSFENKIARRYSGGVGGRLNVIRDSVTDVIVSAGALGERTTPLPPGDSAGSKTLARGISSLRLRRDLSPRVSVATKRVINPRSRNSETTRRHP